jgi:porphobilinogen synthase
MDLMSRTTTGFPAVRMRRLRRGEAMRRMVRETRLSPDRLVLPLFAIEGRDASVPIPSLPGHSRVSPDLAAKAAVRAYDAGVPAVLVFGVTDRKDGAGSLAYEPDGPAQAAVAAIKDAVPEMVVITDVCLCGYTDHGHCGVVVDGEVHNDLTLELLARTAVSHADAGADAVAPSDMMDGRVGRIRGALDEAGLTDTPIVAYSAKYASAFYGPFREAAESAPQFGDRRGYQMDPANGDEALREVALDLDEGADMVMVKPALPYLDVIRRVKERFGVPVAAYNVSGEYSMIRAAAERGWLDGDRAALEVLTAIRRAGADVILTYHAKEVAPLLGGEAR